MALRLRLVSCFIFASLIQSFVLQYVSPRVTRRQNNNFNVEKPLFNSDGDKGDEIKDSQDKISRRDFMDNAIGAGLIRRDFLYNAIGVVLIGASSVASYSLLKQTSGYTTPPGMQRLPRTQFIAALGDPVASEGTIAQDWGLWTADPGPRGVWLRDYEKKILGSEKGKFVAPAGWTFDPQNWWLEEHGLIMEAPDFPLKEGKYLVTGGRKVTTTLTIEKNGKWKLDEGTLYDVTHLPCRSARYQPIIGGNDGAGSPTVANPKDFPVTPGAVMPSVPGAMQQDYAVLFVVAKAV